MKNRRFNLAQLIVLAFVCLQVYVLEAQTPPYSGTVWIESGIITDADCSTLSSVTYTGQGIKVVYDRRVNAWVSINAHLFDIVWNDSLTSQAVVNPEFNLKEATVEANKYGFKIGQLPHCLRTDVNEIWIHKGANAWGGGNKSILIHTDGATWHEKFSEETLIHEAAHTSLDATHASHPDWINAQNLDGTFISTYAENHPGREDIAESFLLWLAVRYFPSRISTTNYNIITQTIPNRLLYFDAQNFNLNPIPCSTVAIETIESNKSFLVYPNPTTGILHIESPLDGDTHIDIYDLTGRIIDSFKKSGNQVDLSAFSDGVYLVLLRNNNNNIGTLKVIKNGR